MSTPYRRIPIDEFARLEKANGHKPVLVNKIWWVESKPHFFRPLYPLTTIDPEIIRCPRIILFGGYQVAVQQKRQANSTLHYFAYDELPAYAMDVLSKNRRKKLKKAMRRFRVERFADAANFTEQAHPVYIDFFERTRYGFGAERLDKIHFSKWAQSIFTFKDLLIHGYYHDSIFAGFSISYQVEDAIIDATLCCSSESLKHNILDFHTHIIREAASGSSARLIFLGRSTGKQSLDAAKRNRGCKILHIPAYFKLDPLTCALLKWGCKSKFNHLTGDLDYLDDLE